MNREIRDYRQSAAKGRRREEAPQRFVPIKALFTVGAKGSHFAHHRGLAYIVPKGFASEGRGWVGVIPPSTAWEPKPNPMYIIFDRRGNRRGRRHRAHSPQVQEHPCIHNVYKRPIVYRDHPSETGKTNRCPTTCGHCAATIRRRNRPQNGTPIAPK